MVSFDHSDRYEYVILLISEEGFSYEEAQDDYDALWYQQYGEFEEAGVDSDDFQDEEEKTWLYENPDPVYFCACGQLPQIECEEFCLDTDAAIGRVIDLTFDF